MDIENKPQRITTTPEKLANKSPGEPAIKESAEAPEKSTREIMLDFLIYKNLLTKKEANSISSNKVDELIVRTAHKYELVPDEIPQFYINKARRTLGLQPNLDEGEIDTEKRGGEIKKLTEEMREYLKKFKAKCPEVLGMILCGSRMDADKLPAPNSDVDTVLVLKEGTITDPRTEEGETLLYRLRDFSDNTPTDSGFPVELNESYSTDDLFVKLQNPTDKNKLIWGWDPKAIKYIGENIGDLDELETQIKILEGINHPDMIKFKKQKVTEAKELITRHLGQPKPKK
ncbi:hypothetical protein KJ992_01995 [Patescibacteria group bacterium]|nr:hypothetical protein [Patescibacteria group bacterium]